MYSEPGLWGTLVAEVFNVCWHDPGDLQNWLSKWRRLLGRVGGVVGRMTITAPDPRSGWQAALELLPLLGPQLEMLWLTVAPRHSLTLLCQVDVPAPPAELLQSLPRRFPRLRLLRLRTVPKLEREGSAQDAASLLDNPERLLANCLPLPALWPAALAQLPLTDLQLDVAHPLPDGLVASLPTGLTWLRLAVAAAPLAQLQGLTALSQLQGLELCDRRQAQSGALLAVPAPAAFPKLQHFEVFGRQAKLQVRTREVGHAAVSFLPVQQFPFSRCLCGGVSVARRYWSLVAVPRSTQY